MVSPPLFLGDLPLLYLQMLALKVYFRSQKPKGNQKYSRMPDRIWNGMQLTRVLAVLAPASTRHSCRSLGVNWALLLSLLKKD